MKKLIFFCFMVLPFFGTVLNSFPKEAIKVDVLYMNHGPMRPTLRNLDDLFSSYGSKIAVSRHDFESKEGEQFKAQKGIRGHVPLAIWIEGKSTVQVDGKPVTFSGFPTGSGPSFFQGKWDIDDLKMALDQATSKN